MLISQFPQVNGIGLYQTDSSSANATAVGQRFQISGGDSEVVLVKAGAVGIVPGKLYQSPAIVAAHQGLAVSSYEAPSSAPFEALATITMGATGVTANQYQGGFLVVVSGTGVGQKATILSNTAATATNNSIFTLQDVLATALDNTSVVNVFPNAYNGVIVNPTTATNSPVGISYYAIPAGEYGYLATKGEWACLNQGGTAIGLGLAPSSSVAGALATAGATLNQVAAASQAGVDGDYSVVKVNL